ncbi:hypothetical protein MMC21_001582 [Puttea exsequens]|nr:hypothetical protein [Puttea exsequens]
MDVGRSPIVDNHDAATLDQSGPLAARPPSPGNAEKASRNGSSSNSSADGHEPHRLVAAKVPVAAYYIAGVALAERFCYFGIMAPLQNYIQNPLHDPLRPGALDLGQSLASLLVNCFNLLMYITPLVGAVVADSYIGRYRTLFWSLCIYIVGATILVLTSLPIALSHGAGIPGVVVAMLAISCGVGGVKATVAPFLAEQCTEQDRRILIDSKGRKVIVDRDVTVELLFNIYYWAVNLGGQSRVATTFIEKDVGFWASFTMSIAALCSAMFVLWMGRRKYVDAKPNGSILPQAGRALGLAVKGGCRLDAAKQDAAMQRFGVSVPWTDTFIEELKIGLVACRALLPFTIYWLCQAQMNTNLISQAASTISYGLPNDLLPNLNSLTVLLTLPLATSLLYPFLRRHRLPLYPLTRIALGFALETLAMAYAATLQHFIYAAPPCYARPLQCPASNAGAVPNHISMFLQIPIFVLEAMGEVFSNPAAYEYAFTKSPKSMKSAVQALFGLTAAGGSLLGLALAPTYGNPRILFFYAGLAAAMGVTTGGFWVVFRGYNRREGEMNRITNGVEGEEDD